MKADGSLTAWSGDLEGSFGGSGAPTDNGYTEVFSTSGAFAAMKADGSLTVWGHPSYGGSGAPTDPGYGQVVPNYSAFVAMKPNGNLTAWGPALFGGSGAPASIGTGYEGGGINTACTDIDECASNNGGCDPLSHCINTEGGSSCGDCFAGYTGTGDTTCVDINECDTDNGGCVANTLCSNTIGGFTCSCEGLGFSGDEVECNVVPCVANSQAGSVYVPEFSWYILGCACDSGYEGGATWNDELDQYDGTCENIDECATGANTCGPTEDCTDTPGAFVCTCGAAACQNGGTATGTLGNCGCACAFGYSGANCEVADPCTAGSGGAACQNGGVATGTTGTCGCECALGYSGPHCETVDLCTTGPGGVACENGGTVTGTIAAGDCACACAAGYSGSNCETALPCTTAPGGACQNGGEVAGTTGNCGCACDLGYSGGNCETVELCTTGLGGAVCQNGQVATGTIAAGDCACACPLGYSGANCETVDPCTTGPGGLACENGGTASGTIAAGDCACNCPIGYSGANCEIATYTFSYTGQNTADGLEVKFTMEDGHSFYCSELFNLEITYCNGEIKGKKLILKGLPSYMASLFLTTMTSGLPLTSDIHQIVEISGPTPNQYASNKYQFGVFLSHGFYSPANNSNYVHSCPLGTSSISLSDIPSGQTGWGFYHNGNQTSWCTLPGQN